MSASSVILSGRRPWRGLTPRSPQTDRRGTALSLRRIRLLALGLAAAVGLILGQEFPARGQGIIIDRRPHIPVARSYAVREVSVDARVRDQVAEVQVTQVFHNPGSVQLEVEYDFPL